MAQQFDYPKTETQLREIQDKLYQHSKEARDAGDRPAFKGLLEIMSAEVTIITAIHNIKSNHGSETPGVDSKTMRNDYLHNPFSWVVNDIQSAFRHYEPQKIRRVYIDKPGKSEKRPLGIPTIRDRIVQECMRIVLEPIFEAQFFAHSYGFRPMRDASMALERTKELVFNTGYYWIVEGDISKCFDRIDHSILLKRLYHMGVKDRRVLQIIKAMLKAGVMDECEVNAEGTPQGGLISPLLANVYLDIMDEWITKQWELKHTQYQYAQVQSRYAAMRKRTHLIPGCLVRYADDFVIITDTRAHAENWKIRLQTFLQNKMKLTLSQEKTLILPSRKILGKKGKVWYHKRYGIYRFKESREIRTQGDTQAGRTAQENGKNGKRNRGINRSTAESRKRNMDSVSTRGRKFAGAKKVRTKAGQPHGPYSGRTRKYPKGNRREDTGGFRDHRQAVDIGTDAAVHSEAVSQGNKRANTVGLHEALGHELPASSEACPEAESYRHLKVEKRGISRNFKACGGGECHNLLGR